MIKDSDKEDEEAISKLASSIKTDEEPWDSVSRGIQSEQSSDKGEVKKEMEQLQEG